MVNFLTILLLFSVFSWILIRINRRQQTNFTAKEIIVILGVRVILGCIYGYIFSKYFHGDDTWYFHQGSIDEYEKLVSNPIQFFADPNPFPAFRRNDSFTQGWYYYLSDLEFWLITKPLAFFNIITRGNYYANVVCFNFLVSWGSIWLFRFLKNIYPSKRTLLFLCVFVLPIPLFWMTGIRSEGWLLFFLAGILLCFERLLRGFTFKHLLWLLASIAGLLILRSVLLLILIPVFGAWWLEVKKKWRRSVALLTVVSVSFIIFFGSTLLNSQKNLPNLIVKRQQSFFSLHGQTRIALDSLTAKPSSFLNVFPQAFGNSFFRPFLWEAKGSLQVMASISTLIFFLLVILFLIKRDCDLPSVLSPPGVLYPAVFTVLLFLFIGYTVPFPGAIIRYKSIGEWFLIVPLMMNTRWSESKILKNN